MTHVQNITQKPPSDTACYRTKKSTIMVSILPQKLAQNRAASVLIYSISSSACATRYSANMSSANCCLKSDQAAVCWTLLIKVASSAGSGVIAASLASTSSNNKSSLRCCLSLA